MSKNLNTDHFFFFSPGKFEPKSLTDFLDMLQKRVKCLFKLGAMKSGSFFVAVFCCSHVGGHRFVCLAAFLTVDGRGGEQERLRTMEELKFSYDRAPLLRSGCARYFENSGSRRSR